MGSANSREKHSNETSRARPCTYLGSAGKSIRGFRVGGVVRILGMWPKLRGQVGPAPSAGDQEPGPESDPQLELISVPDDSNVKH